MAKVEFSTDNLCIQTEKGETILDAALKSGIPHVHACGGNAFCSTCRILVEKGGGRTSRTQRAGVQVGGSVRTAQRSTLGLSNQT